MWSLMSLITCSGTSSEAKKKVANRAWKITETDGRRAILVKNCLTDDHNALFVDEIRRKSSIFARIIKPLTQKDILWLSYRQLSIGENY